MGEGREEMNITPKEFIDIQHQAARKAVESVTEVKGLGSIECGVHGHVWLDEIKCKALGRLTMKLAGHTSTLDLSAVTQEEAADGEAFSRIRTEIRDHIVGEVERAFGDFLQLYARRFCQIQNVGEVKGKDEGK